VLNVILNESVLVFCSDVSTLSGHQNYRFMWLSLTQCLFWNRDCVTWWFARYDVEFVAAMVESI